MKSVRVKNMAQSNKERNMKKIIKLFCVVSCLMVCFAGCGKEEKGIAYNPDNVRAYLEFQITNIADGADEFVGDETATFINGEDVYDAAVASWNSLSDECGEPTDSVSDFEINEQSDELNVTEVIQFEDRKVNITSTFEEDDGVFTMTSLSFEPVYTVGEKLKQAGMNTAMGMGTVFVVLIFISLVISLFNYIPQITEFFSKKNKKGTAKETTAEVIQERVVEQAQSDDTELIAVIAAAIAASENTTTDSFVVRSIRKR